MKELKDFYRGDTKRWSVIWPFGIEGSTSVFRLARSKTQAEYDLEVTAILVNDTTTTFEISAADSADLAPGTYFAEHETTLSGGDVITYGTQRIKVLQDLPETGP